MQLKKSKLLKSLNFQKKLKQSYSESEIDLLAGEIVRLIDSNSWIFLNGDLGTGKSTLTRALLKSLGFQSQGSGSPSFPIVHEYDIGRGKFIHMDLYRLESEKEIEDAGLLEYFGFESTGVVVSEWFLKFPDLFEAVTKGLSTTSRICLVVDLEFVDDGTDISLNNSRSVTVYAASSVARS